METDRIGSTVIKHCPENKLLLTTYGQSLIIKHIYPKNNPTILFYSKIIKVVLKKLDKIGGYVP